LNGLTGEQQGNKNDQPGLPDFSWYNIPKREKYTKLPQNVPNVKKYPMSVK
jgi:hypothetical protein